MPDCVPVVIFISKSNVGLILEFTPFLKQKSFKIWHCPLFFRLI